MQAKTGAGRQRSRRPAGGDRGPPGGSRRRTGVLARDAFAQFGKRRSPAGLNYGDCFSYALAQAMGRRLLFKGSDFAQTDVMPAVTG